MKSSLYLILLIFLSLQIINIKATQEPNSGFRQNAEQDQDDERLAATKNNILTMLQAIQAAQSQQLTKSTQLFKEQQKQLEKELAADGKTKEEIEAQVQTGQKKFEQQQKLIKERHRQEKIAFLLVLRNQVSDAISAITPN